jgi:hypothetical protein
MESRVEGEEMTIIEVSKPKKILGVLEYKPRYKDWNDIKIEYYQGEKLETKRKSNWIGFPASLGFFILAIQGIIIGVSWAAHPNGIQGYTWDLLIIGMPVTIYLIILTYFIGRGVYRFPWLPFERKTVIWTKIPYGFWVIISILWLPSLTVPLLAYAIAPFVEMVKHFDFIWNGFEKSVLTFCTIWYLPDGKAEGKIKEIWANPVSNQKRLQDEMNRSIDKE